MSVGTRNKHGVSLIGMMEPGMIGVMAVVWNRFHWWGPKGRSPISAAKNIELTAQHDYISLAAELSWYSLRNFVPNDTQSHAWNSCPIVRSLVVHYLQQLTLSLLHRTRHQMVVTNVNRRSVPLIRCTLERFS
jgi:hypothetical protein